MAPQPPSSPSSAALESSVSLTAASPGTLLAPAPALRRLLLTLSKNTLIDLVLHWLSTTSPSIARPTLSSRAASSSTSTTRIFLHLHEQRRASSLPELRELWGTAMRDATVPKARAVDRALDVDWQGGLSYAMVAMVACEAVRAGGASKTWTTARLDFEGGQVPDSYRGMSPHALRSAFSVELAHYFTHHLHLDQPSSSSSDTLSNFVHLRLVLPPLPVDVCGGTHILLLPGTPYVLLSGSLSRTAGTQSRTMLLAALAHAAGARGASVASAASEEEAGLGELKGKNPAALREVLLGAATGGKGGGAGRDMHAARAEDDPLVEPGKRRRAKGGDEGVEIREDEVDEGNTHPAARAKRRREEKEARNEREREVQEVFGTAERRDGKDKNDDLERIERMDYELHLPTPSQAPYRSAAPHESEPIRLRLQGTHVLAGLRSLVAVGADRATSSSAGAGQGRGLPGWLTEPSGTRIVVRPVEEEKGDESR